ncbi:substrate-binding domain-containing protein [Helicobacter sp. MIT 14-3879]|uniref:substrate-binding domain-containing protein n=1 Tax=Helicobacter sp. MIT 14-3879 TaxID=2040649 RepID=UPI000E1EFFBB|nr:substrate-binding domain-containing protein [Helicobacter sp. MIT 14-3879]RDU61309.1 phosphate ABC transporter substrate-binding protein [Helicobacter sp. MIT 14-3879]
MKKILSFMLILTFASSFAFAKEDIYPITREMGSGTRGAFVEIFDILKDVRGKKIDSISPKAEVTNSTGVMMASVAGSKNAIGYVSLGALNGTIKALSVDGIAPSVANINNKQYKVFRPFNVVIRESNPLIKDFLEYAINAKSIIQKAGYIAIDSKDFSSTKPSGKLTIAGSSSVTPLMEKLVESYRDVNPNAKIEIQQSDSSTGLNSLLEGIADIAMLSRSVKQSELDKNLSVKVLAIDGLAIIVNKDNPINNLSSQEIKQIFTGVIDSWEQIKGK